MISDPVTRSFDSAYGPSVTIRSWPPTDLPPFSSAVPRLLVRPCRASSSDHLYHFSTCAWSTDGETSSWDTAPPRKISMYLALGSSAGPVVPVGSAVTDGTISWPGPLPIRRGEKVPRG